MVGNAVTAFTMVFTVCGNTWALLVVAGSVRAIIGPFSICHWFSPIVAMHDRYHYNREILWKPQPKLRLPIRPELYLAAIIIEGDLQPFFKADRWAIANTGFCRRDIRAAELYISQAFWFIADVELITKTHLQYGN